MSSTTVNRKELHSALHVAVKAICKRNPIPILGSVLFAPEAGALKLTATDLEVGVVVTLRADSVPAPAIALPAKELVSLVKGFTGETVTCEWEASAKVRLTSGTASATLAGTDGEEFPTVLPGYPEPGSASEVPVEVLADLSRVAHAASTDETRYNLNGVCVETGDGNVRWIATDGHRLVYLERLSPWPQHEKPIIMPRRFVSLLAALVNAKKPIDSHARISVGAATIEAQIGNLTVVAKLIEGTYPNYLQVIPKENEISVGFYAREMREILARVGKLAPKWSHAVKLDLAPGDCRVSASNPDLGTAEESVTAIYKGEPISIGFNYRYLIDALDSLSGDLAVVDLHDASTAAIIREEKPGSKFLAVVMPNTTASRWGE
jgi:DNA polymerase-3 subunit beta